jgi:uncharacterized protein YbjT (DUF2867 family)
MAIGAQDDVEYLINATRDVDALLWVTPPGYGSDNVRSFQNRLAKAAVTAIRTNRIPRVVNLSSIGADQPAGAGPISGLCDVEHRLDDVTSDITHLRPGFFYENLLWQMDPLRKKGVISLPINGSRVYPTLATRDIGRVAAERLANAEWSGHYIRELYGPEDLSFEQVAAILSRALNRKISYVPCEPRQARQAIIENGVSENAADLLLEMYDAIEKGRVHPTQLRSEQTTTTTTLADFAREVLQPLLTESVAP